MFINGQSTRGWTTETIAVIDPATEAVLAHVPRGPAADVEAAVSAAAAAFPGWCRTSANERARLLHEAAAHIRDYAAAPPVISRAEWSAAQPDHTAPAEHGLFDPAANRNGWLVYAAPLAGVLNTLIVHHSAYAITHLAGHAAFQPGVTLCPGQHLAPLLPDLAADLGLAFGTGGYVPPDWSRT